MPPWLIPAIAIAVVVAIIGAIAASGGGGDDDQSASGTTVAGTGEIFLEDAAAVGQDPFTQSTAAPTPSSTVAPNTPVTLTPPGGQGTPLTAPTFPAGGGGSGGGGGTAAIRPLSGATPGLYGGTGSNDRGCDKQQMIDFLRANPSKAAAWAEVQGIAASEVPAYIDGLTPVMLRSDTRVTNHGFRNGRPTPRQAVFRAGTWVLIDNRGLPRARCACGNPVLPPVAVPTTPTYTGPRWPGFTPTNVTVIQSSTTTINVITVINITNGTPYGQPTGPGYPPPVPLPPLATTTTAPATTTTTPPTTGPPGTTGTACPGSPGSLLETLTVNASSATGPSSRTYPANCGYRVVFRGDTDWNTSNSFSGGFETHYCYDPQYCNGPTLYNDGGGFKLNGVYVWQAFGTQPPAYTSSHVYTYNAASLPGNRLATGAQDVAYGDNSGSWTVEIYRA
jgi:hypothetical protein